jgi:putative sigma-54 modulation protein
MLNFTGHNIEITPSLRSLIEKKFKRIKKHLNKTLIKADVVLSLENLTNIAKINIHAANLEINAHGEAEDMYKAIDLMLNKLNRQIIKNKEKGRKE